MTTCAPVHVPFALPDRAALEAAVPVVRRLVPETPAYAWPLLAERCGCTVWVKHENHTPTGAFKIRGGLTYMRHLRETQPCVGGVITATRGNHGQSVALAARTEGLRAVIVVPEGNNPEKNAAMKAFGAELIVHGHDFQAAAEHALALASTQGLHMVPAYHPWLIEGVGTYAMEFLAARPDLEAVFLPIGMGSGISGMVAAKLALGHQARIYGVVAEGAPAYALSFRDGRVVPTERADTMADGVACRSPDERALEVMLDHVADIITVSDAEIATALRALLHDTHNLTEGAAAAPLAGLLKMREQWRGRTVGLALTGGNIDAAQLRHILKEA